MTIYRLVPSAPADDPNWGLAINHGEVVVRAHTTGEARAIAALEEASVDLAVSRLQPPKL
jgi:hypothetical protein